MTLDVRTLAASLLGFLAILFAVLDGWSTWYVIGSLRGYEMNPLIAALIEAVGLVPAMIIRVTIGIAVAWMLVRMATLGTLALSPRLPEWVRRLMPDSEYWGATGLLIWAVVATGAVVVNNLYVIVVTLPGYLASGL